MEENVFFNPGDIVTLKKSIPNAPKMLLLKRKLLYSNTIQNDYRIKDLF